MIASSSSSPSCSSSYCYLLLIQSVISICCCTAARSLLAPVGGGGGGGGGGGALEYHGHPSSSTDLDVSPAQPARGELSFKIGSRPPSCSNKCNSCLPCQAVQVPAPLSHHSPSSSSTPSSSSSSPQGESSSPPSQVCSEYSNYKPEGWKCKCGNKLYNP
ncbi:EPIDERMAL PATTERNING FACTOR-like protein 1 [Selaginella moellendorffii]|uniref:EPIDERMAL PATTERNING FACTOR-like protein 1 n=1 Tax=Selaginella moellendorffii TaxID=88036 RepID=UPI000D1C89C5|nr:EPIDERMAL PATTERNING FACTOR-like protein 1 [Selaginella moellendorffii]|eukprot:XP_024520145.1 EPIDERMAL PATTERNING FACTOR-like protein 1 [Selaginella moellendorffii]